MTSNQQAIGISLLTATSNTVQTCGIGLYSVATLYFCRQIANLGCHCIEKIPALLSDSTTDNENDNQSITVRQVFQKTRSELTKLSTTLILVTCGVGLRWMGESITSSAVQQFLFGSVIKS